MPSRNKSQPSPLSAQVPTAATAAASRSVNCATLSDCANDNSTVEGLETFDVGEYHLTSCPICLEHFTLDNPAILLKCEHGFHLQCLESWRQRASVCPMCLSPMVGDEGRIMSPADVRRRRRLRLRTPTGILNAPERSTVIDAAVSTAYANPGCEHSDCEAAHTFEQDGETDVIVVSSAEEDPRSWCGWLHRWCCVLS